MKKRIVSSLLAATLLVIGLSACGGGTTTTGTTTGSASTTTKDDSTTTEGEGTTTESEATATTTGGSEGDTFELALITDVGTIDDKSFNQGSWEGLVEYAEENDITHKYYKPTEKSDAAYMTSIDLAVEGGAKVIVTPGFLFEVAVFTKQAEYPDVRFILIDGAPHNADYSEYRTDDNVHGILYREDQSGFLAGYAAVHDGYRKLGFMGGMAVPAVIRFGYGFLQGAEMAAEELGLAEGEVTVNYTYLGDFVPSPDHQTKAAAWYNDGIEVIFACAGGAGNSVMKAAEAADGKVIGVDVDQSPESATVITSAVKNLQKSVYDTLVTHYDGTWQGGEVVTLGAAEDMVLLPMESSKFETFTQEQYDAIYAKLVADEIELVNDVDAPTLSDLLPSLTLVKTTEIK